MDLLERLMRIKGEPVQMAIDIEPKLSHEEEAAWSALYEYYKKYAPRMRAAHSDIQVEDALSAAAEDMERLYTEQGLIGRALAGAVYELLDMVRKEAHNKT